MRPSLKLVAEVRDLQIVDREMRNCGICDDVEFEKGPRGLWVKALLVGPGALLPRLPRWLGRLVTGGFGRGMVRIPWQDVESISGRIILKTSADAYRLNATDHRLARILRRIPAL